MRKWEEANDAIVDAVRKEDESGSDSVGRNAQEGMARKRPL